jgi:hypothetical protein
MAGLVKPQRPDCVAEVVGLELRNVVAKYLFETSHRFAGMQPNSDLGDYSRLSCGAEETQLGPSARISGSVPPGSPYDALASPARSARA